MFELVHCDMCGPSRLPTSCGVHYFLTMIDDNSRVSWLYLMREKREDGHFLNTFISLAKTQFDKCVKVVRTNNGVEFKSGHMRKFYTEKRIIHQTSYVETPQQNGRVE